MPCLPGCCNDPYPLACPEECYECAKPNWLKLTLPIPPAAEDPPGPSGRSPYDLLGPPGNPVYPHVGAILGYYNLFKPCDDASQHSSVFAPTFFFETEAVVFLAPMGRNEGANISFNTVGSCGWFDLCYRGPAHQDCFRADVEWSATLGRWVLDLVVTSTEQRDAVNPGPQAIRVLYYGPEDGNCHGTYTCSEIADEVFDSGPIGIMAGIGQGLPKVGPFGTAWGNPTSPYTCTSSSSQPELGDFYSVHKFWGFWQTLELECVDPYDVNVDECETCVPNHCREQCYDLSFNQQTVGDGTCSECSDFNGGARLNHYSDSIDPTIGCVYRSDPVTVGYCLSDYGAASGRWYLVFDQESRPVISFVVFDGGGSALGTLVNYTDTPPQPTPLCPGFGWTFWRQSQTGDCDFPNCLRINACPSADTGACCQTSDSFGFAPCFDTTETVCAQLHGQFLGVGTSCGETCTCAGVQPCQNFSNVYTLSVSGVTGTCAAQINGDIALSGGGFGGSGTPCEWTGSNANWSIVTMTIDPNTDPPTINVHGVGQAPATDTEAFASGAGYCCNAEEIVLTLDSFTPGTFCGGTDWSAATITIQAQSPPVTCPP